MYFPAYGNPHDGIRRNCLLILPPTCRIQQRLPKMFELHQSMAHRGPLSANFRSSRKGTRKLLALSRVSRDVNVICMATYTYIMHVHIHILHYAYAHAHILCACACTHTLLAGKSNRKRPFAHAHATESNHKSASTCTQNK